MRNLFILIVGLSLVLGCAGQRAQVKTEWVIDYSEMANIGIIINKLNNKLFVESIDNTLPAGSAGVKRADVIASIDGKTITTREEYLYMILNKQRGDHLLLTTNRNGDIYKFDVEPKMINVLPSMLKIAKLLAENAKVSIAIIVSEVKSTYPNETKDWIESTRRDWQSLYEQNFLKNFESYEKATLVDRSRFNQLLEEYKLSQLGIISDKLRVKIGEMAGATHILDISVARYQGPNGPDDIASARLIDVESGRVLAVDRMKKLNN